MKWLESRVVWGFLLILGGILFLLENLHILSVGNLFWAILFGLIGLYILAFFLSSRSNWWAIIPGVFLLDLALIILLGVVFPRFSRTWSGGIFLGIIGLSFWLVYLMNRDFWWAIIPGGVLFTLAAVSVIEPLATGFDTGGVLFLGLGLTFALVGVLPASEDGSVLHMRWAFIPAGILVLIGLLITAAARSLFNFLWPAALIVLGLFLIYRTFFSHHYR